ncbi:MAG: tyrosine-type recombinase/integrase [Bacteroidales bacterium]|nr:tyrosine-type recombinase/integrase [Bacteroidales bacterium]
MKYRINIRPNQVKLSNQARLTVDVTFHASRVRVNLGYTINLSDWNDKRGELKPSAKVNGLLGSDINKVINNLKTEIDLAMMNNPSIDKVRDVINECLGKKIKGNEIYDGVDILQWFDIHNREREVSANTIKGYKNVKNNYAKYLEISKQSCIFTSVTPSDIDNYYSYLKRNSSLNYANTSFKRFKAFWRWCRERLLVVNGVDIGFPFKTKMTPDMYGTPNWLNKVELDVLINAELTDAKERTRDIFIFQCFTACRVSDMVQLRKSNVYDGVLSYIPQKTINKRAEVVRVPLTKFALSVIEKYANDENDALLPFISPQKYNDNLKDLFKFLNLDRPINRLNPHTNQPEIVPLFSIASSHLARRTFVGQLYEANVKDSIISSMSGHAEGSKAFNRYRAVTEELKENAIKVFE